MIALNPDIDRGPSRPLLVADRVHVSYGPTIALRGASVSVSEGEVVALVGPSGSGKSTLLQALAGISIVDSGSLFFDGQELSAMSDNQRTEIRRLFFGFVMQFGHLVPDMSLVENVSLPLMLRGISRRRALRVARESLCELGLRDELDRRPGQVSGGQQQRAAVGRALIGSPRVIFADEPTGALDTENGDLVMDLLTRRARSQGTTVLLVTHDASRLEGVDRVVSMRDGVVMETVAARL